MKIKEIFHYTPKNAIKKLLKKQNTLKLFKSSSSSLRKLIPEKGLLERNCEAIRLRDPPRVWKRLKGVTATGRIATTTPVP